MNYKKNESIQMTEKNLEHIIELFDRKKGARVRIPIRSWILVAACFLMLFVVGFINFDAIRKAFEGAFHELGGYISQFGQNIEAEYYDNGIRLKVLSTINDDEHNYTFFTLTDETGDRLSEDMVLLDTEEINEFQQTDYDPNTKTATFLMYSSWTSKEEPIKMAVHTIFSNSVAINTLEFEEFNGNALLPDDYVPDTIELTKEELQKGSIRKKEGDTKINKKEFTQVLYPDQIKIPLGIDVPNFYISNMGYIGDFLHVQVKFNGFQGGASCHIRLYNTQTGKYADRIFTVPHSEKLHKNQSITQYIEYVFQVEPGNLKDYRVEAIGKDYHTVTQGSWEVSFQPGKRMAAYKLDDTTILDDNGNKYEVTDVLLSPLSLSFTCKTPDIYEWIIEIEYKDGSIVPYPYHQWEEMHGEDLEKVIYKLVGGAIVIEDVAAVIILGSRIPIKLK